MPSFVYILAAQNPGASIWGLNISEEMLRFVPPGIHTSVGSMTELPFPASSFDCVYATESLEHAVEIERALGASGTARRVSRASVYRILDELERLELVQRVETRQAMVRYERVHEHEGHHHHLVCDECGLVMPFSDAGLERAIDRLSKDVPLTVSEHEIVLHGYCRDCAA